MKIFYHEENGKTMEPGDKVIIKHYCTRK